MDEMLILRSDFPDPDVIRVGDAYCMASTTMHFMPGCAILRSYDLRNWEFVGHVYDRFDGSPAQRLDEGKSAYGQGMWAPSLRYHKGVFHICFVANDSGKTYLYRAKDIAGPWEKSLIRGFYHDSSLLFDDDGRVYVFHGNRTIYLTELDEDLAGPKPGGLHRVVAEDAPEMRLGYEGTHAYKIDGKYYLFFIHWGPGDGRRTEACFVSDSLTGEFKGRDVFDDDLGFHNQGVAQGGIVDAPDGKWYAVLFQDHGAAGRVPVLLPVSWNEGFPVFGDKEKGTRPPEPASARPRHRYAPLFSSDDFRYPASADGHPRLKPVWEWNHEPDDVRWSVDPERGELRISSDRLSPNLTRARNVLTQRAFLPRCAASARVDASSLREGDYAGICALQGRYGMIAATRREGRLLIVMKARPGEAVYEMGKTMDLEPGTEFGSVPAPETTVELRVELDFRDMRDEASFFYREAGAWKRLGPDHKLRFGLDPFVGCRFGLFMYSTESPGGEARFGRFEYELDGARC